MTSNTYSVYADGKMSEKQLMEYHAEVELREWKRRNASTVVEAEWRRRKLHLNMQVMQHGVSPVMAMVKSHANEIEEGECNTNRWKSSRRRVDKLLSHWGFDACLGLVILMNALTIGIATSKSVQGLKPPLHVVVLEDIFLGFYIIELALRFFCVWATCDTQPLGKV